MMTNSSSRGSGGIESTSDKTNKEDEEVSLEWHPIKEVYTWIDKREVGSPAIDVPPSLQQTVLHQKDAFQRQISELEGEVSGSKQVFDTYRERARVSLQKTASEQQEVEKLLVKAKEECKLQAKRAEDAMKQLGVMETQHELVVEDLKARIEHELKVSQHLQQNIQLQRDEIERSNVVDLHKSSTLSLDYEKVSCSTPHISNML